MPRMRWGCIGGRASRGSSGVGPLERVLPERGPSHRLSGPRAGFRADIARRQRHAEVGCEGGGVDGRERTDKTGPEIARDVRSGVS